MKEKKDKIKFVHLEHVEEVLETAINTNTNIILHGPGGFGKTELVKSYVEKHNLTVNYVVGYKNMMVEALLGVPNMQKLMDDSEYSIAFDKSVFVGAEVLVLEEFLDVMPETAAALKDIITEGGYRQKGIFTKSDVKLIIMITNKSPDEIEDDDSLKAFYLERFPIHVKVDWSIRSTVKYHNLLSNNTELKSSEVNKLAHVCGVVKPSPRIALKAGKLLKLTNSFNAVSMLTGFKNIDIQALTEDLQEKELLETFTHAVKSILRLIKVNSDDIGVQLYMRSRLEEFAVDILDEHHRGTIHTLLGTVQQNINSLMDASKDEVNGEYKEKINETFRDLKF